MPIRAWQGDITTLAVDAVVNAANERLAPGGGVCGAIHRAAGPGLAEECAHIGHCATGHARATGAHDLPARWVVHAVGPVWRGGDAGEAELLASCYRESLDVAAALGARSIAFPAISTGIYGYPAEEAAEVAVAAVHPDRGLDVVLVAFVDDDLARYRRLIRRYDDRGRAPGPGAAR